MAAPEQQPYRLPEDAVWFITGCSSGIGLALATLISAHPTQRLVATARNISALSSHLTPSDRIFLIPLDVTSPAAIDSALTAAVSKFSRIDVVVNNAGFSIFGDAEAVPDDLARALFETNFWGPIRVMNRALGIFRDTNNNSSPKTGGGGVIVNISSMGGRLAYPGQALYHASKFALEGYTESVARELRPEWGIHLCLVEPGGVQTNYATSSLKTMPPHPAYATPPDTPSRVLERFIADPRVREGWAEPGEVARAIVRVVGSGGPGGGIGDGEEEEKKKKESKIPLRVSLGGDSWASIKMAHVEALRELEEGRELAMSVGKKEQMRRLMEMSK